MARVRKATHRRLPSRSNATRATAQPFCAAPNETPETGSCLGSGIENPARPSRKWLVVASVQNLQTEFANSSRLAALIALLVIKERL